MTISDLTKIDDDDDDDDDNVPFKARIILNKMFTRVHGSFYAFLFPLSNDKTMIRLRKKSKGKNGVYVLLQ